MSLCILYIICDIPIISLIEYCVHFRYTYPFARLFSFQIIVTLTLLLSSVLTHHSHHNLMLFSKEQGDFRIRQLHERTLKYFEFPYIVNNWEIIEFLVVSFNNFVLTRAVARDPFIWMFVQDGLGEGVLQCSLQLS